MPRNWSTPRFSRPWSVPDGVSTITPTDYSRDLTAGQGITYRLDGFLFAVHTATVTLTRRPRTQAERSAETQEALLDATVDALVERGWAGTSPTEIVRRAGVSRGAQAHHYPTKADLVVAAVEHVFARQEQAFSAAFRALPAGERTLPRAIDLLASLFEGPAFPAVLELIVAARTDPELGVVVAAVGSRFGETVAALFEEFFPEVPAVPGAPGGAASAFPLPPG